ncbi:unnamed protein product [[Actinomadura] parvosata subsp. kistnae]|uniref:DUF998 domain-containing protein n=1 Tax=[Actinomadura] parvosata subsp. kistnae TaxID=1909395 RepID=A0A1V0A731_9ACTN|nr:DUF998 domain-containing protein [Nonomuraea sp. ATCC 55076]AQZ66017.1 hypothetical protein BKM31_35235 [Nonomuraea sp. ATCC 55076]SPL97487.1 unnamed protein product [Actinomadura parvosata subsp. kistnae]
MTPRQSVWSTVIGTLVSAGALAYADVALPTQVLLSDYALVPGGMLPVLIGMLALAVACLGLAYGLTTVDPARTAPTRVLLVAGAAGLMMSAIFPTDPGTSQIGSVSGEIHRWSAAVVFTSLPVAGWILARGRTAAPRWNAVRAISVAAGVTLAVYLAAHPASITSSLVNGGAYYGMLERGVVLAEMALLIAMALAAFPGRAAAKSEPSRTAPTQTEHERQERLAA